MMIMAIQNGLWDKKIKGDKTSTGTAIVQFKPHSESPFEIYLITIFQKVKLFSEKNSKKLTLSDKSDQLATAEHCEAGSGKSGKTKRFTQK